MEKRCQTLSSPLYCATACHSIPVVSISLRSWHCFLHASGVILHLVTPSLRSLSEHHYVLWQGRVFSNQQILLYPNLSSTYLGQAPSKSSPRHVLSVDKSRNWTKGGVCVFLSYQPQNIHGRIISWLNSDVWTQWLGGEMEEYPKGVHDVEKRPLHLYQYEHVCAHACVHIPGP